jgi:hypothetical protein
MDAAGIGLTPASPLSLIFSSARQVPTLWRTDCKTLDKGHARGVTPLAGKISSSASFLLYANGFFPTMKSWFRKQT